MPRNGKKSHVFPTKPKPKRSSTVKRQHRNFSSTTAPAPEVLSSVRQSQEVSGSETSANSSNGPSCSNDLFLDVSTTATSPTLAVQSWLLHTTTNSGFAVDLKNCSNEQLVAFSEFRATVKDTAKNSVKRKPLVEHRANGSKTTTKTPGQSSTRCKSSALKSLGSSIMFGSLFDVKDGIMPTCVPPIQQLSPRVRPVPPEAEQVPAYATTTHAAWFSNPANKLVRGVPMGVLRSVAELQRIGRTAIPALNIEMADNLMHHPSTVTCGRSERVFDEVDTPANSYIAKRFYATSSRELADSHETLADPLLD